MPLIIYNLGLFLYYPLLLKNNIKSIYCNKKNRHTCMYYTGFETYLDKTISYKFSRYILPS